MPIEHLVDLASPFTLYLSAYLTVSCLAFFLNLVAWDLLKELVAVSMSLPTHWHPAPSYCRFSLYFESSIPLA
jgi:hypothetical protein